MASEKPITGTREWATHNVNCCSGCSHGCLYCYARDGAVRRGLVRLEEWPLEQVRFADVERGRRKVAGRVMFPTTHDITPHNLGACKIVLRKLLDAGNEVLIVSKPHRYCIEEITETLALYRPQVLFRFSIGAMTPTILDFWEPNAPAYEERLACLELAHERGWQTSVSAEPLLEAERVIELVDELSPWVTDSIWIGKANELCARTRWALPPDHPEILRVLAGQTDERVGAIYEALRDRPLIRWKESYKTVLGLELADRPGLDV